MYVEDLLVPHARQALAVRDHQRLEPVAAHGHQDRRLLPRYARELDPVKRRAIAKELLEYMADKLYWNTPPGHRSILSQQWMKGYTYNAEFEVHYETVSLEK